MRLSSRVFLLLLSLAALAMLAACGGSNCSNTTLGSTGGSTGTTGGISTGGSVCGPGSGPGLGGSTSALLYYVGISDVEAASLTTSGSFTVINPFTPPTLPSNAADDMLIVNKTWLYVPMSDTNTVQAFAINRASGALTAIPGSPFAVPGGADVVTTDPADRFLFVGAEFSGPISVFQIDQTTGALVPAPGSPFTSFNLIQADSITVDGLGKFLYVGQIDSFLPVVVFSIDQNNGALSEIVGSPFSLGVAMLQADSSGTFLLGIADETGSVGHESISVFRIDPVTGAPSAVTGSPFPTSSSPINLTVHPSGRFVYTMGHNSSGVDAAMEGFQIDTTTGALTLLPGSPFVNLPIVEQCKFDQSGGEMFCADIMFGTKFSVLDTNASTGALSHTVLDLTVPNNFPFAVTD